MIRRLAAALMLSILMFNMGGYFLLYALLEKQAEARISDRIIRGEYSSEELVEIKLSFEMPYPVHDGRLELEDPGRIKASDEICSVVSHTYTNNTLTVVGVRDQWAMHVDAVMLAFNEAANGNLPDGGIVHGITNLLQLFVNSGVPALIESGAWTRLLDSVEFPQYFAEVSLPSDIRPPCS